LVKTPFSNLGFNNAVASGERSGASAADEQRSRATTYEESVTGESVSLQSREQQNLSNRRNKDAPDENGPKKINTFCNKIITAASNSACTTPTPAATPNSLATLARLLSAVTPAQVPIS
jgi:hypothetical protein